MAEFYIQSVTISPNPVMAGAQFKIEVEFYALFPSSETYPGADAYPGSYNCVSGTYPGTEAFPGESTLPGADIYT